MPHPDTHTLFLSLLAAAGGHFFLGNNITIAVLGVVIPIGKPSRSLEHLRSTLCMRFSFTPAGSLAFLCDSHDLLTFHLSVCL